MNSERMRAEDQDLWQLENVFEYGVVSLARVLETLGTTQDHQNLEKEPFERLLLLLRRAQTHTFV